MTERLLTELLHGLKIRGAVPPSLPIRAVSADTRHLVPGSLFVAIGGSKNDGLSFLHEAISRGAIAALIPQDAVTTPEVECASQQIPVIPVPSIRATLAHVAARFYGEPAKQLQIFGVTGTNGKTTCAWLVQQALEALGHRVLRLGTAGNYLRDVLDEQSDLTTLDPVALHRYFSLARTNGATFAALEASSHALDQERLAGVPLRVALFTNLTRDHLDYHGSFEAYEAAKRRIFDLLDPQAGVAVVNSDSDCGLRFIEHCIQQKKSLIAYGHRRAEPILRASSWSSESRSKIQFVELIDHTSGAMSGSTLTVDLHGHEAGIPRARYTVRSPLLGAFNAENLLGVFCSLLAFGVAPEQATEALAGCKGAPGRLERFSLSGRAVFVDYAHTPDALSRALDALQPICRGKLSVLFGCGGDRDRGKRPEMGAVADQKCDKVYVTSDNPRSENPERIIADIVAGISPSAQADGRVVIEVDRAAAIASAVAQLEPGDILLVAGKGHEQYQILGTQKISFSDQRHVQDALARFAIESLGGPKSVF